MKPKVFELSVEFIATLSDQDIYLDYYAIVDSFTREKE